MKGKQEHKQIVAKTGTIPGQSLKDKLQNQFIVPAITGALAFSAFKLYFKDSSKMTYFGMPIDTGLSLGLAAATGSFIGELSHNWIMPHIQQADPKMNERISMALNPTLAAITAWGILKVGSQESIKDSVPLVIGLVSNVGATYIEDKFF